MLDNINIDDEFWEKFVTMPEDKFNGALDFLSNLKNIKEATDEKVLSLKIAEGLVKAAKNDLKAIELLYNQGNYSLSTYHLQQSVEKITKAYGLAFNLLQRSELGGKKGVGHDSPLMFVKGMEKHGFMKYILALKHFQPELKTDIEQLEVIVKDKKLEIAKTKESTALAYLQLIDKLQSRFDNENMKEMIEILADVIISSTFDNEEDMEKAKVFFLNNFKMDYVISFISLYLLSCLTFPHEAFTRYPDSDLKPDEYKKGMGIVDVTSKLIPYIEKTIKDMEDFLVIKINLKVDK